MKTELITTFYQDFDLLPAIPYIVHRAPLPGGEGRTYYTLDEKKAPTFYISLTTLTRFSMPTPEALIKWMCDMGYDNAKRYLKERQAYGSLLHYMIGLFFRDKVYSRMNLEAIVKGALALVVMDTWKEEWADDIHSDMIAFAQFVHDHKVKPMAIEIVMASKDGYATMIDLVCKMVVTEDGLDHVNVLKTGKNAGQPRKVKVEKEITALINFKSGRKGFYDENQLQLEFERRLFEENYPDVKIDAVFNWSPKEWRTKPGYNLKDQTGMIEKEVADARLVIAKSEMRTRMADIIDVEGDLIYGHEPKVIALPYAEYVGRLHRG